MVPSFDIVRRLSNTNVEATRSTPGPSVDSTQAREDAYRGEAVRDREILGSRVGEHGRQSCVHQLPRALGRGHAAPGLRPLGMLQQFAHGALPSSASSGEQVSFPETPDSDARVGPRGGSLRVEDL